MKPHLSISQLNMLTRCGYQYQYRYLEGLRLPPGVALVVGSGTHEAIEKDLQHKIEWGELLDEGAVKQAAADAVARKWADEAPVRGEDDPDLGGAIDEAMTLATLHHQEVAPTIQPVAVERKFTLDIDAEYDLVGVIDVEEAGRIRDTKTSGKAPAANAAAISDQLTAYHWEGATRGEDKLVALDYLVKSKRPKATTLESTRTEADHERLRMRLAAAWSVIKAGAFLPAPADSWACSARWCGFWDRCPFGARNSTGVRAA